MQKYRQKMKAQDPSTFKQKTNEAAKKYQQKKKDEDLFLFNIKNLEAVEKCQRITKERIDDGTRILNFEKANLFGPIFICSCCKRRLYENGVTKITPDLKQKFEDKHKDIYRKCVRREELVKIKLNGSDHKTGHYLCGTCKSTMMSEKVRD